MVWKKAGTSCPVPVLVSESTAAMEEDVRTLTGVRQEVPVMGYAFESEASELWLHEKLFI